MKLKLRKDNDSATLLYMYYYNQIYRRNCIYISSLKDSVPVMGRWMTTTRSSHPKTAVCHHTAHLVWPRLMRKQIHPQSPVFREPSRTYMLLPSGIPVSTDLTLSCFRSVNQYMMILLLLVSFYEREDR